MFCLSDDVVDSVLKFNNIGGFDFLLKQQVVEVFKGGVDHLVRGDLKGAFESFKSLLLFINSYDYSSRDELQELSKVLGEYFDSLSAPNSFRRRDQITLHNKQKVELRELLDVFVSEIPKAFAELGLWFSTVMKVDDFDLVLSNENFNSDFSGLKGKRDELRVLSKDDLLSLLSANMVHDVYARWRMKDALGVSYGKG